MNITFDSVTNKFYCTFLNQQHTSGKSCNISYGTCGNQLIQTIAGYSKAERPNLVEIRLPKLRANTYCYVVAASSDTFQVLVEGSIVKKGGRD